MNEYLIPLYSTLPLKLAFGRGYYLWDTGLKRYLDFYGGHAVAILGHHPQRVVMAVKKQMRRMLFYSNAVEFKIRDEAAKELACAAPGPLKKAFFCNSGSEANEAAVKFARKTTGREGIVAMEGSFHGRTMGSLSATWGDGYKNGFGPLVPGFGFAKFGDIGDLEKKIGNDTAAVIIEPIQGVGGVNVAPKGYLKEAKKICEDNGSLLILDEVQTGFGRTGKMFCCEHFGVSPDIMTMAKGIAAGFPMGAVLVTDEVSEKLSVNDHASTFGGGPIACAAMKATIHTIQDEGLVKNAAKVGAYMKKRLEKIAGNARGIGLMLGAGVLDAKGLQLDMLERGLIIGTCGKSTMRLLPPIIIRKRQVDVAMEKIAEALG